MYNFFNFDTALRALIFLLGMLGSSAYSAYNGALNQYNTNENDQTLAYLKSNIEELHEAISNRYNPDNDEDYESKEAYDNYLIEYKNVTGNNEGNDKDDVDMDTDQGRDDSDVSKDEVEKLVNKYNELKEKYDELNKKHDTLKQENAKLRKEKKESAEEKKKTDDTIMDLKKKVEGIKPYQILVNNMAVIDNYLTCLTLYPNTQQKDLVSWLIEIGEKVEERMKLMDEKEKLERANIFLAKLIEIIMPLSELLKNNNL